MTEHTTPLPIIMTDARQPPITLSTEQILLVELAETVRELIEDNLRATARTVRGPEREQWLERSGRIASLLSQLPPGSLPRDNAAPATSAAPPSRKR